MGKFSKRRIFKEQFVTNIYGKMEVSFSVHIPVQGSLGGGFDLKLGCVS